MQKAKQFCEKRFQEALAAVSKRQRMQQQGLGKCYELVVSQFWRCGDAQRKAEERERGGRAALDRRAAAFMRRLSLIHI